MCICKEESLLPVEADTFDINVTVKHVQSIGYPVEMSPAQKNTGNAKPVSDKLV